MSVVHFDNFITSPYTEYVLKTICNDVKAQMDRQLLKCKSTSPNRFRFEVYLMDIIHQQYGTPWNRHLRILKNGLTGPGLESIKLL